MSEHGTIPRPMADRLRDARGFAGRLRNPNKRAYAFDLIKWHENGAISRMPNPKCAPEQAEKVRLAVNEIMSMRQDWEAK